MNLIETFLIQKKLQQHHDLTTKFKGTIEAPKMQRNLFCFCVQTDRKLWSFKLL